MIKFLKNLLPKTLAFVAWVFDLISKCFVLSSFFFHKLFRTDLGLKLIKFEAEMKKAQDAVKKIEEMARVKTQQNSRKSIIPMNADPKLVKILSKGSNDDGSKN